MTSSGTLIGERYLLERIVGTGATSEVWVATDTTTGRTVAVKLIRQALTDMGGSELLYRMRREADLLTRLNHPNVVSIHAAGQLDDGAFIVMEYVDGETLAQRLARTGPITSPEFMDIAIGLARGLRAAHDLGITHRDVKPANVLLGGDGSVKLVDFGIARSETDTSITSIGFPLGTPNYMAPEVAAGGRATVQTDIYSLGLVFLEALSGREAVRSVVRQQVDSRRSRILRRRRSSVPSIPDGPLTPIVIAMLAVSQRPTADHVVDALLAASTGASPEAVLARSRHAKRKLTTSRASIALVTTTIVAFVAGYVIKPPVHDRRSAPNPSTSPTVTSTASGGYLSKYAPQTNLAVYKSHLIGTWRLVHGKSIFTSGVAGMVIYADGTWQLLQASSGNGRTATLTKMDFGGTWSAAEANQSGGVSSFQTDFVVDGTGTYNTIPLFSRDQKTLTLTDGMTSTTGIYEREPDGS